MQIIKYPKWDKGCFLKNFETLGFDVLFGFLQYLALDVTANCICEVHCIALDGFDFNTVHQLSSKEKKY